MEEALINLLLGATAVNAIVAGRVFPLMRPQDEPVPAITLQTISGAPIYVDEGELGIQPNRVQVDCWAATYGGAKTLARAVKAALSNYEGTEATSGVTLPWVALDAERDEQESGTNAAEYLFRTSLDFIVWQQT